LKFYATEPSRGRLQEDVLAFVSLLRWQRDEQAEKMVLSTAGGPAAVSLHTALVKAKLAQGEHEAPDSPWRDRIDDPLDPYGPESARHVEFAALKGPLRVNYRVSWGGAPSHVVGRFTVEPRGAGFTLGFSGFEVVAAPAARHEPSPPKPTEKPAAAARKRRS
jgi:hypothetical protein